ATLTQQLERLRVITTVRATLVMVICVLVGALLHLENGSPLLMTVIILVFFLRDESIGAGLQLVLGSAVAAVVAFVLIDLFLQARPFYLAINLLLITPLAYWAAQGLRGRWRFPFCAIIGIFVLAAAAFGAIAAPGQGDIASLSWVISCVIGVALIWTVLIGLWPSPRLADLIGIWSAIERSCAALLRDIADEVAQDRPLSYRPSPLSLMFFGKQVHLLDTDGWRLPRGRLDELRRRVTLLSHIYVNVRLMARALEGEPGVSASPDAKSAVLQVLQGLARALDQDAGIDGPSHQEALRAVVKHSRALGEAPSRSEDQARLSAKLTAFSSSAAMVIKDLERLRCTAERTEADSAPELTMAAPHGFRLQPDSVKAALKMALGILIGLSLHFLTTIPAGSYLMLGMVIALVQPNLGRSQLRIRLTLPGALFGTLYSLLGLTVISLAPHFSLLLAFLALGFLIGGYYSAGPDRVSFGGIQFTMAMAVILGMAAFPIGTVTTAEDRLIGALLAFAIALGVGQLIWPEHPAKQLRASVAANLGRLPAALERLSQAQDPDPPATRRMIHQLKLDVQSDFGLLYDFSYMFTRRVQPAYDYTALVHGVGTLFVQVFAFYEMLDGAKAEDRQVIVKRLQAATPRSNALLKVVAGEISQGRTLDHSALHEEIAALANDLTTSDQEATATDAGTDPWLDRFALNGIREVLYQMNQITAALSTHDAAQVVPSTSSLVHRYEATG
ncbi:MAG: FUSC family protein, partial [Pseudomonadota bacterium]